MEKCEYTGTVSIERGEITERRAALSGTGYVYRVKSLTRDGIVSRWMEAAGASADEERGGDAGAFAEGDGVYYFMFPDGRGMILGRIQTDL